MKNKIYLIAFLIMVAMVSSCKKDDNSLKLVLSFSANPFDELNDDWHVTQQSSTIIKLQDVSGGNGGTDYLTFERV